MDKNGNHSDFSAAAMVYKSVLIPPIAPVAESVYSDNGSLFIDWRSSRSGRVWGYEVYRQEQGKQLWDTIALFATGELKTNFTFRDTSLLPGV